MSTAQINRTRVIQGEGYRHDWGIRRVDGQPWRTEPSEPGAHDYYVVNDEVSHDAMVLGCADAVDAAACMLAQDEGTDVQHAGEVVIVQARYQHNSAAHEWGYYYEDVPFPEILRAIRDRITGASMILSDLAQRVAPRATETVDVVFDRLPDNTGANFIEVEDAQGVSIKTGEWITRPDGYAALRVEVVR